MLPDATESQIVASGFHRNAPTNLEAGTDPAEDHYKMVVDRVNTTGTIWLGTTLGCAQCHNHKYDPISARDYYALFAFFNNTPRESKQDGDQMGMSGLSHIGPTLKVAPTAADARSIAASQAALEARIAEIESAIRKAVSRSVAENPQGRRSIPEDVLTILDGDDGMSLAECKRVLDKVPGAKIAGLRRDVAEAEIMQDRVAADRGKAVRVMREMDAARPTFIARRGDFLSEGERVEPATPGALHDFPADLPRDRLGLARWLAAPENPLAARAFVNRLWIEVFGQGLVTTPGDFGTQGERPTHPQLLDWLAVAFWEDDHGSLKSALRRVLLSATYRQSTAFDPTSGETDPLNQLLWRHPGHRLHAETIRDQALAISGLLVERLGGPSVRPFQPATFWRKTAGASETYYIPSVGDDAYRRGAYTLWRRNAHYPSFANFDAPDRTVCVVQRDVSNTPLQALTLLNDPVYVEVAEAFGRRIAAEGGATLDERLLWAFRTALARFPSAEERALLRSSFDAALANYQSDAAAFREIATILLNLHESINRS